MVITSSPQRQSLSYESYEKLTAIMEQVILFHITSMDEEYENSIDVRSWGAFRT